MRIYLSCLQSKITHPIPSYHFWEIYFKNGINEAGYQWIETPEIDWAEALIHKDKIAIENWKTRTWTKVIKDIKQQHRKKPINFFLSYFYPVHIEVNAIKQIQELGIPCINFFCDNVREFTEVPNEFLCFDLHWVPEYKAIPMYKRAGLQFVHAPMPMWVEPKYRLPAETENDRTIFIGSKDKQRSILLSQIINKGLGIEICGSGWQQDSISPTSEIQPITSVYEKIANQISFLKNEGKTAYIRKVIDRLTSKYDNYSFEPHVRKKPSHQEYITLTRESMITLGVNRYPSYRFAEDKPNSYSRLRDIEAPMLGACYLTEWTEGIENMYELGKEIETYKDADQLIEKVKELKENPYKRRKMRELGQRRALKKHSVTNSINDIIKLFAK